MVLRHSLQRRGVRWQRGRAPACPGDTAVERGESGFSAFHTCDAGMRFTAQGAHERGSVVECGWQRGRAPGLPRRHRCRARKEGSGRPWHTLRHTTAVSRRGLPPHSTTLPRSPSDPWTPSHGDGPSPSPIWSAAIPDADSRHPPSGVSPSRMRTLAIPDLSVAIPDADAQHPPYALRPTGRRRSPLPEARHVHPPCARCPSPFDFRSIPSRRRPFASLESRL